MPFKKPLVQFLNCTLATIALSALPVVVYGKQCDNQGQLKFLGTSAEGDRTAWLSATSAGAYRLDAAQGNQTVDTWNKDRRGLHLSLSPIVSSGNGGTHKLYTSDDCLVDTQNQKNGFTFPSSIVPPGITRPPSNRPIKPITPTVPGAVTPPIGKLPTTPLTPTVPGAVTPPIETLPTTPLTPTVPGAVTPPIGKLPTTPLTPTVPGAVTPPIGKLPTTPLTPTVPGAVTPPIGTLPTTPLTPTVPGAVTPPIGTLPTTPLTPTVPGAVTPPIGTLPTVPPSGSEKTDVERDKRTTARLSTPLQPCRGTRPKDGSKVGQVSDCYWPITENQSSELPLTPGRELMPQSEWNLWIDGQASQLRDKRDGMDTHGNSSANSIGLDRVVTNDLVTGFQLSIARADGKSFDGDLRTDSTSYLVGPYLSYSISPDWFIYGSLGFGRESVDTQILSLNGNSDASQYSLNMQAEGQYAFGSTIARPKILLSHTHNRGDNYQLQGDVFKMPLTLNMRNQSFDYGRAQGSLELNRTIDLGNNRLLMPYIEAGIYYEYDRPQSGQYLTSNLTYADSSPWGGVIHAGARALIGNSTTASFELGSESIGVNDVSIWELRLLVSYSF